jgi:taurine transport system permease protein
MSLKTHKTSLLPLLTALTLALLLFIWWAVTGLNWINPLFLPSPQAVVQKFLLVSSRGFMDATLQQHVMASLQRIVVALFFSVICGIPLGLLIGLSKIARAILDPLIELYRPIPPLAYLPLIVIWCGIGELSKVLLIYLAMLAPVVIGTASGVSKVLNVRLRAAQTLGANRWQQIGLVVLPSALPDIMTGIRIGLGTGWSTLVAAELVAATKGLGFMVQSAAQFLVTDIVIMGIVVIALIALLMELSLRWLTRKFTPWQSQGSE